MEFRFCGLMFLFIPLGMFTALLLYRPLTALLARLPLPGIVPKGMVLDDSETNLKLVLSGWYAIHFQLLILLETSFVSALPCPYLYFGLRGRKIDFL